MKSTRTPSRPVNHLVRGLRMFLLGFVPTFLAALLLTILIGLCVLACGCRTQEILVPFDAPLKLSRDETIHDPYVMSKGQWTLVHGTVTRHAGARVTLGAATRPATQAPTLP